jgi:hypothetical protein
MLRGTTLRLLHNPLASSLTNHLHRLKDAGCNAIALVPHHYVSLAPGTPNLSAPPAEFVIPWFIYPDVSQDPAHAYHNTTDPALTYLVARAARDMGMVVLLKPHLDSYSASWRGNISVKQKAVDFAWSYRHRLLPTYISMAKELGLGLCMGCELYTVTKELGAGFWSGLAVWIREQGFTGPLTYAANWGWADDAEYRRLEALWPILDYVSVNSYFPLMASFDGTIPTVDELVTAWHRKGIDADWCPPIDDDLIELATTAGKRLVMTEVGYANRLDAFTEPGRDSTAEDTRWDEAQVRGWQALRQRWDAEPVFGGYMAWETLLDPQGEISHEILGRPAEAVVFG